MRPPDLHSQPELSPAMPPPIGVSCRLCQADGMHRPLTPPWQQLRPTISVIALPFRLADS